MSITPLLVQWKLNFNITDNSLTNFKSGDVQGVSSTFTQAIGASILVPQGTSDEPLCLDGLEFAQAIFLMSDQAIQIKLVPQGSTLAETSFLTLMPNMPSLLSVQNVVGIYVSNPSGPLAKLIFQAAGV